MEIKIVKNVLAENENLAQDVRDLLRIRKQSMINFMSSPGSGKTTLLEKLIPELQKIGLKVGVIEGDITTSCDADRLHPLGIPIAQINTELFGGSCHLGANVILSAMNSLSHASVDVILLENVGNLVCPAEFDTGAHTNVVLLSLPEGEDKPLKYPLMFQKSDLALINKMDLLEVLEIDISLLERNIIKINPRLKIFKLSAKKNIGISSLADWIATGHQLLQK